MEMEKAGVQSEIMTDAFGMLEDPDTMAEADDLYGCVLAEIGLEYANGQPAVPIAPIHVKPEPAVVIHDPIDDEMEARLAALRM